eukprot:COSAG04_NODE_16505_length_497_cov_0.896985_2_plen_56_part_01
MPTPCWLSSMTSAERGRGAGAAARAQVGNVEYLGIPFATLPSANIERSLHREFMVR